MAYSKFFKFVVEGILKPKEEKQLPKRIANLLNLHNPEPESHKEAAHILGLLNNPYEESSYEKLNTTWYPEPAVFSVCRRYGLYNRNDALNLRYVKNYPVRSFTRDVISMENGDYIGLYCDWLNPVAHGYTWHAIKENNQIHFIYFNRGRAAIDYALSNVIVFSVEAGEEAAFFARELIEMVQAERRESVADFLRTHQDKKNNALSTLIDSRITDMVVSNCSTANSNSSWNFQLAANYLKQNQEADFVTAYQRTYPKYKEIRNQDRLEAFQYLLKNATWYVSEQAYVYDCIQALKKFIKGDRRNPLLQAIDINPEAFEHLKSILLYVQRHYNNPSVKQWCKMPSGQELLNLTEELLTKFPENLSLPEPASPTP